MVGPTCQSRLPCSPSGHCIHHHAGRHDLQRRLVYGHPPRRLYRVFPLQQATLRLAPRQRTDRRSRMPLTSHPSIHPSSPSPNLTPSHCAIISATITAPSPCHHLCMLHKYSGLLLRTLMRTPMAGRRGRRLQKNKNRSLLFRHPSPETPWTACSTSRSARGTLPKIGPWKSDSMNAI